MNHVVLLGDSVFDNGAYVPGEPAVVEQLQSLLPAGWRSSLLAVDGSVCADVAGQLKQLPEDCTHIVLSIGGNDALGRGSILYQDTKNVSEALGHLKKAQAEFREDYRAMLELVLSRGVPTAVCTVYDSIPRFLPHALTALVFFNDVILREAFAVGLPVIDTRLICQSPTDYSAISPIEPSAAGGQKIASAIVRLLDTHDFSQRRTAVFGEYCM